MELRQLEYFQMASRLRNITRAAERLRVSQPNITVAIKKLEAELGIQLFDRSQKQLSLTPEGEIYFNRCTAALDMISDAESIIEAGIVEPSGLMRLTVPVAFGHLFIMPLLNIMALKYRTLNIEVDFSDRVRDPACCRCGCATGPGSCHRPGRAAAHRPPSPAWAA